MKFKHKKTGAVIDVLSRLGGAWEPVKETVKTDPVPAPAKPKKTTKKKG